MTAPDSLNPLSAILKIPELFETVLSHLPLRDLLVNAQLVSRTWRKTVTLSPTLQQCLFFAPRFQASPEYNPLLEARFPPWFRNFVPNSASRYPCLDNAAFEELPWNTSGERRSAYKRKEASWRKMLVVQPPVKDLVVESYRYGRGSTFRREGRVKVEEGARMGMLYDLAFWAVKRSDMTFGVVWEMGDGDREERGDRREREVKMIVKHTVQCVRNMTPRLGSEFKSEAYEKLDIEFSQGEKIWN